MCYLAWTTLRGSSTAALTSNPLLAVWAAHLVSYLSGGGRGWSGPWVVEWAAVTWAERLSAGSHGRTDGGLPSVEVLPLVCTEQVVQRASGHRHVLFLRQHQKKKKKTLIRKSREDYITRAQTEQWETVFKKENAPIWSGTAVHLRLPSGWLNCGSVLGCRAAPGVCMTCVSG